MVADGKEAFIAYFERMAREVSGQAGRVPPRDRGAALRGAPLLSALAERRRLAGIDIFRLDGNGKIVEHWDVLQRVPAESANPNTIF
jgi:predicted SnoaL-like aldol condensation-catalyzing enzyme